MLTVTNENIPRLRVATADDLKKLGPQTHSVMDLCPRCSRRDVPLLKNITNSHIIVTVHSHPEPQNDVQCSYGGKQF